MHWKKKIFFILIVLFLCLLEVSFFPVFDGFYIPVMVFSFSLALLSLGYKEESFFVSFWGGLLLDIFAGRILGLSSFIFLALILLISFLKQRVFDNLILYLLSVIVFSASWQYLILDFSILGGLVKFLISNLIAFLLFKNIFLKFYASKPI